MYKDVWKKAAALFLCACMAGTSVDLTAFTVHAQEQTATEEKVEAEKTEQPEITDETTEDAQKSEVQTEAVNQEEEQSVSTYIAPLVGTGSPGTGCTGWSHRADRRKYSDRSECVYLYI